MASMAGPSRRSPYNVVGSVSSPRRSDVPAIRPRGLLRLGGDGLGGLRCGSRDGVAADHHVVDGGLGEAPAGLGRLGAHQVDAVDLTGGLEEGVSLLGWTGHRGLLLFGGFGWGRTLFAADPGRGSRLPADRRDI